MKPVKLDVVATPGCQICRAFEDFWRSIEKDWPGVSFRQLNLTESAEAQALVSKNMIFASPAIFLNGELWASGGFDRGKFIDTLRKLSQE